MSDQDKDLIRALTRLSVNSDFHRVAEYLSDSLSDTDDELRVQNDEAELRRLQGRAKFIAEFLDLVSNAPLMAQKYEN